MPEIKLELDNLESGSFNLYEDNHRSGIMMINIDSGKLYVFHTQVADSSQGKGYAKQMFNKMVDYAKKNELQIIPICPFVRGQLKEHPDKYEGLWKKIQIEL